MVKVIERDGVVKDGKPVPAIKVEGVVLEQGCAVDMECAVEGGNNVCMCGANGQGCMCVPRDEAEKVGKRRTKKLWSVAIAVLVIGVLVGGFWMYRMLAVTGVGILQTTNTPLSPEANLQTVESEISETLVIDYPEE